MITGYPGVDFFRYLQQNSHSPEEKTVEEWVSLLKNLPEQTHGDQKLDVVDVAAKEQYVDSLERQSVLSCNLKIKTLVETPLAQRSADFELQLFREIERVFFDTCKTLRSEKSKMPIVRQRASQGRSLMRKVGNVLRSWQFFEVLPANERGMVISSHRSVMSAVSSFFDRLSGTFSFFSYVFGRDVDLPQFLQDRLLAWVFRWRKQIQVDSKGAYSDLCETVKKAYRDLTNIAKVRPEEEASAGPQGMKTFLDAVRNIKKVSNAILADAAQKAHETPLTCQELVSTL